MKYPKEFAADAQARVEAKITRARMDFQNADSRHHPFSSRDVENVLINSILKAFLAFAQEAFKLGEKGTWTVSHVDAQCREFLRLVTIQLKSGTGYGDNWINNYGGGIESFFRREYEKSPLWQKYQRGLLKWQRQQGSRGNLQEKIIGVSGPESNQSSKLRATRKPGPKGPRDKSTRRRLAIVSLYAQNKKGRKACVGLTKQKIDLPTEELQVKFKGNWILWYEADRQAVYRQLADDRKRAPRASGS